MFIFAGDPGSSPGWGDQVRDEGIKSAMKKRGQARPSGRASPRVTCPECISKPSIKAELKWSVQNTESYCCAIKTIKKEEIWLFVKQSLSCDQNKLFWLGEGDIIPWEKSLYLKQNKLFWYYEGLWRQKSCLHSYNQLTINSLYKIWRQTPFLAKKYEMGKA